MKIFTALECITDFPDDRIEDGDEIVRPPDRTAARAVSDLLKNAGMITSIPELDTANMIVGGSTLLRTDEITGSKSRICTRC
jgi:hypothetical protein